MKYYIRQLGSKRRANLTLAQYEDITQAITTLIRARNFEQKFHLLVRNFADLEQELLRLSTTSMLSTVRGNSTYVDAIFEVSLRLVNVLTTARLYVDQVKHDISQWYGRENGLQLIEAEFCKQYDRLLGYRVMDGLRNYVQHEGLPIQAIAFSFPRVKTDDGKMTAYVCTPLLSVSELKQSGFKRATLKELEQRISTKDDQLDLKPFAREYLVGLMAVHLELRKLIAKDVSDADKLFLKTIRRYRDHDGNLMPDVAIFKVSEQGNDEYVRFFLPEIIATRKRLQTHFEDLRTAFVTSAAIADVNRWGSQ